MKLQIIFKSGRTMYLDNIKTYVDRGNYWEVENNDGDLNYIEGEILYIGQPEHKPEITITPFELTPARRKLFKL